MKTLKFLFICMAVFAMSSCTHESLTEHDEIYNQSIDKDEYEVPPNG